MSPLEIKQLEIVDPDEEHGENPGRSTVAEVVVKTSARADESPPAKMKRRIRNPVRT